MKNMLKITALCSLLIIVSLLIGGCGGGTEQLARNQGDVAITVTNSGSTAISGVLVEVRQTQGTGAFTTVGTTSATGQLTFTGTAGTVYYFQLSKSGLTTQTDIARTPQLTSTVTLNVIM